MAVLGDHVGREARSDAAALVHAPSGRTYDYRRFCTTAWKTGNFLRHLGVRRGARVGVADDPRPEAVAAFYGAALLGAVVAFDPAPEFDGRALVVPSPNLPAERPGTKRVGYGAEPDDPAAAYFERDVWSENPTTPPDDVAGEDDLLAVGPTYTHAEVLAAARDVVERWNLTPGDEIAVRASLSDPGAVAAGLVAPVVAGAVVLLPDEGTTGDYAVGDGPEDECVAPDDVA